MPIDYSKYPPNWKSEIWPRILERDEHKCKFCGVENGAVVYKGIKKGFKYTENYLDFKNKKTNFLITGTIDKDRYRIVLTIAHLDHDEENQNVQDDRLAALCQKCHLRYDAIEKSKRRQKKRYSNSLFPLGCK